MLMMLNGVFNLLMLKNLKVCSSIKLKNKDKNTLFVTKWHIYLAFLLLMLENLKICPLQILNMNEKLCVQRIL